LFSFHSSASNYAKLINIIDQVVSCGCQKIRKRFAPTVSYDSGLNDADVELNLSRSFGQHLNGRGFIARNACQSRTVSQSIEKLVGSKPDA